MNEILGLILLPELSVLIASIIGFIATCHVLSVYNPGILQAIHSRKAMLWGIIIVLPIVYIGSMFIVGGNLSMIGQFGMNLNAFRLYANILLYIGLGGAIFLQLSKAGFTVKGSLIFIFPFLVILWLGSTFLGWFLTKMIALILFR